MSLKFALTHCLSHVVATIQNHAVCTMQFYGKVLLICTVRRETGTQVQKEIRSGHFYYLMKLCSRFHLITKKQFPSDVQIRLFLHGRSQIVNVHSQEIWSR